MRFKPDFEVDMLRRSAEIAFDGGVTIYDALPVAVAEKNGTVCVTADERTQYSRLKEKYPVRLLRNLHLWGGQV